MLLLYQGGQFPENSKKGEEEWGREGGKYNVRVFIKSDWFQDEEGGITCCLLSPFGWRFSPLVLNLPVLPNCVYMCRQWMYHTSASTGKPQVRKWEIGEVGCYCFAQVQLVEFIQSWLPWYWLSGNKRPKAKEKGKAERIWRGIQEVTNTIGMVSWWRKLKKRLKSYVFYFDPILSLTEITNSSCKIYHSICCKQDI